MAWHEFIVVEELPKCRIACFNTVYPPDDLAQGIDIGPLFPLFFASAQRTCERETGRIEDDESIKLWMGPTRYHLPPTTRWMFKVALKDDRPVRDRIEVWMAVSDRVALAEYGCVRQWDGGLYASVESGFDTPISESWQHLLSLLDRHGLSSLGHEMLVENFQAANHGGWDRYRVMAAVDPQQMRERRWTVENCSV